MATHPLAGKPAPRELRVNVPRLISAYYTGKPDASVPEQQVAFGTSGHRGSSLLTSFNEDHILAICQALCEWRRAQGIDGPLYIGMDTHALSEPALSTAVEVFAANAMDIFIQAGRGYTPTPVISHAILIYNRGRTSSLADGVVITPSHNPPEDGGFKYNPPSGGPADTQTTKQIQDRANQLLAGGLKDVRRMPLARALKAETTHMYDYVTPYVADLGSVIDMQAIAAAGITIGVDPMGGAALGFWAPIAESYKLNLQVVNPVIDPTFAFMTVDKDGKIRMDCSSPYAMAGLIGLKDRFDIAFGNDPDSDRHGIVTPSAGLMNPNHYLATAIQYLFQHRPGWRADAAIGKTLVSSSMIDRVAGLLGRRLAEVPVGFKWFVDGLLDGSYGFGGEESAGASFLRTDGTAWTTDKDGLILGLLAAEITARTERDPAQHYHALEERFGSPLYERMDAPSTPAQKAVLNNLSPELVAASELAGEPIIAKLTRAPGNDAPIGGLKIVAENGWFAARPSGTENIYKIYAESFKGQEHLAAIQAEAQAIVSAALAAAGVQHMLKYTDQELRLLQLLSQRYPTITAAHIEMINLHAILALPKGTDHYISDIHGAYEQFDHILRHASGAIRRKINQTFGSALSDQRQVDLAMLIYYPEQKLHEVLATLDNPREWIATTIGQLARVARTASEKYTRSKVRKRLAPELAYILEELLTESSAENIQKEQYYRSIIESVVDLGEGERAITTLAQLIQRLVVDRLYILGDIYDRGPAAERVIERLMAHHEVTIQWGNHDISWMAAASGCDALIANVIRMALRYASLETLIEGYGIGLRALARFAKSAYRDDPCEVFQPKSGPPVDDFSRELMAKMHKAITIIQLKLEAAIIARHPEYAMEDRLLLDQINLADRTVTLDGRAYPLRDAGWPTLDPADPAALTDDEAALMADLRRQFQHSARLREHIRFLYSYGSMFQVRDGNLLFHGCLPVDEQGEFSSFPLDGERLSGPALLERYEQMAREAFFSSDPDARQAGQDAMWYLWCGEHSPLFGRTRMTTFERYFIANSATHVEPKGPYYRLRESEAFCRKVLAAFGGDVDHGHIINGHTPVKVRTGERPLMANGRLIVIDGGMSEAYQPVTGIAGYTLIANSHELLLSVHEVFTSADEMIRQGSDVTPHTEQIAVFEPRALIAATDTGKLLRGQLEDLRKLEDAYRQGVLVEGAPRAAGR